MKRIYVGHARRSDYENELYDPIKSIDHYEDYEFIFPHGGNGKEFVSESDLKGVDLFICEISYPATGLGIELAFAHMYKVPIVCLYKKGSVISDSIRNLNCKIYEYCDINQMLRIIVNELKKLD